MEIIKTEHLVKRFPMGNNHFTALKDVNLTFGEGEFAGLIGPSGSGKTTLLNIIGSLDTPSEGTAVVLGQSISKLNPRQAAKLRKENLGFIFQSYNLLAVHTVFENVEFPLLLLKYSASERKKMVMDALEWVGLTDKVKSKPPQLSGGECQRVAIARAMVKKPTLVLADEPTANLDSKTGKELMEMMRDMNKKKNVTFIFSTHDQMVMDYARRLVHIRDGLVADDQVKE